MSNTGNNNSSESNIYSFDYDEESKRFSAFLNQTLKGSTHPTDLAMMPHPERVFTTWQWPWTPEDWKDHKVGPWLKMFQNAREFCDQ